MWVFYIYCEFSYFLWFFISSVSHFIFVLSYFYICCEFFFYICRQLFLYLLWVIFIFVVSFFYLQREVHSPEHKFILDLVGIFLSWNLYCQACRKYWTVLIKILWSNSWSAQPHYKLHWIVWFDSPRKGGRGNGND